MRQAAVCDAEEREGIAVGATDYKPVRAVRVPLLACARAEGACASEWLRAARAL